MSSRRKKKAISLLFENTTKEIAFKSTSASSSKPLHLGKQQETPGLPFPSL